MKEQTLKPLFILLAGFLAGIITFAFFTYLPAAANTQDLPPYRFNQRPEIWFDAIECGGIYDHFFSNPGGDGLYQFSIFSYGVGVEPSVGQYQLYNGHVISGRIADGKYTYGWECDSYGFVNRIRFVMQSDEPLAVGNYYFQITGKDIDSRFESGGESHPEIGVISVDVNTPNVDISQLMSQPEPTATPVPIVTQPANSCTLLPIVTSGQGDD